MGVHGLSGRIKSVIATAKEQQQQLNEGSTLCVDGDGLIFELFKLSYRQHYKNIITNFAEHPSKQLQSQLLLPMFTPLSLIDKTTTSYLQNLTLNHGMHLQIFFDGPDQFMKYRQRLRRRDRRNEEWEHTRQLCIHGILPEIKAGQSRSAARRQARAHRNNSDDQTSDDADFFLSSFPYSPLAFLQIKRSIREFANLSSVLFRGSIQLINCKGEADVAVAKAASLNQSAYALANDTDYLIYGAEDEEKVVKYVMFNQINPSDEKISGTILTRSEISHSIGLFCAQAMIEVSILLGNDYTGPLLRHGESKKQKEYWASLRWKRGSEMDTLPNLDNEIQPIIDHVGGRVIDGWTLTSVIEELNLVIEYSYALYSFRNTESFRSRANALVNDDVSEEDIESMAPNLPPDFDEYIARAPIEVNMDIHESVTAPLTLYMSEAVDTDYCVEQKHLDALKKTAEALTLSNTMELPRHHFHWKDVQAIYILEKLLSRVINGISGAEAMPYRVFDHLLFLSYLESLSFEDFSLNDVPTNGGDEDTHIFSSDNSSKKLVLPIDKYREEILRTIKQQRVTIIHGETGCGKSSRVPCFLLRADPPQPSLAAPEVKMIISQPRRIAAKALAERVRKVEPDLANKIALRMGHGIKEFETSNTRAWFVTTGYVVRLLANHPHWFDSHTHLIIDEGKFGAT